MQKALLAAFLGSIALAASAAAQTQPQVTPETAPQGQSQAQGAVAECERLVALLDEGRAGTGVSVAQARAWQQASDVEACRDALKRLSEAAEATPPPPAPGPSTAQPAAPPVEPKPTAAMPPSVPVHQLPVSRIEKLAVYTTRDEKLGDVEQVVMAPDNKLFLVVSHGGFLGLGEKRVAMPLDEVALRGDHLTAETLTEDQIKAMPSWDKTAQDYRELDDNETAPVHVVR